MNAGNSSNQKLGSQKAAALKYDGENAPKLVAKGTGELARQIIDSAKEHDIHIHNDPLLIDVLGRLELGEEIPRELYLAVAKIIAFAYFLQGKHPEHKPDQSISIDSRLTENKELE
ncbi:EscU/YscU/HrcU family type III secretion system export apparatus switch protein [Aliikangiella coralliicola]|uniref:Flagellar biosynthetic protein FlhB n=1 Tax=Aliikangiella coralliicola TaxID=2592383 RepID=A0A545U0A2_9GAMM|nr:EscU/YscU/HrcU family type III secretion system export apparatus switch protein [Aliikangiella coralliicola]TQV82894.1 hypothetical protein FLL46_24295 [Aliikangiella coralliicola]